MASDRHWPALDGLRGVAVLLVFLDHACQVRLGSWLDKLIYNVSLAGWSGVNLFFVLSGFLITGILYDAKSSPSYFRSFYMRRVLRIFPLYFGFLVLVFGLACSLPWLAAATPPALREHQLWYWLYASNLYHAVVGNELPPTIGVFWTLAIEEHFYLLWPMVVFACERKALLRVAVGLALGSLALRAALALTGYDYHAIFLLTPCRLDELLIGAILALWMRAPDFQLARHRHHIAWTLIAAAAGTGVLFALQGNAYHGSFAVTTFGLTVIGIMYGAILLLALAGRLPLLDHAALRLLGRYSYGIYVLHTFVIAIVRSHLFLPKDLPTLAGSEILGHLAFVGLTGAASLTVAMLSYHLYEQRFLRLKRYFPMTPTEGRRQTAPEAA